MNIKNIIRKLFIKMNLSIIHKLNFILKRQQKHGSERILELAKLLVEELQENGYKVSDNPILVYFSIWNHNGSTLEVQSINNGWKIGGERIKK